MAVVGAFSLTGCGQDEKLRNSQNQIQTGGQSEESPEKTEEQADSIPEVSLSEKKEMVEGGSVVYMTTDISSKGLIAVYEKLEASPEGKVAVKLSTGEQGSNYLRTDLVGELVACEYDWTLGAPPI